MNKDIIEIRAYVIAYIHFHILSDQFYLFLAITHFDYFVLLSLFRLAYGVE